MDKNEGKIFYAHFLADLGRDMRSTIRTWLKAQSFYPLVDVDEIMDLAFEGEDAVKTMVVEINLSNGQTYSVCNQMDASLVCRKYKGGRIRIVNQNIGRESYDAPIYANIVRYYEDGSSDVSVFLLSEIVSVSIRSIPLQRGDLSREAQRGLREIIEEWWKENKPSPPHEDGDTTGISAKDVESMINID